MTNRNASTTGAASVMTVAVVLKNASNPVKPLIAIQATSARSALRDVVCVCRKLRVNAVPKTPTKAMVSGTASCARVGELPQIN